MYINPKQSQLTKTFGVDKDNPIKIVILRKIKFELDKQSFNILFFCRKIW